MQKLFDIKSEGLSNEPTNEEIHFITAYLEKQFEEIENTDFETKTTEERQAVFATVNSIKNAIADLLSPDGGNYHKLLIQLNDRINFENRLSNIVKDLSKGIIEQNKTFSSSSISAVHNPSYSYKTIELNNYLNNLLLIPPLSDEEIESQLKENGVSEKPFQQLFAYLNHLVTKYATGQSVMTKQHESFPVVFFLRDTLLLYLGAKRLQAKGVLIDARAVLINRKLIHNFVPTEVKNSIYKKSYNLIFQLLSVYKGKFSIEFTKQYKKLFRQSMTQPEKQFLKFINDYLAIELGDKNGFIGVDTAAHGTMPLLAHVATGRLQSLEMFTSTPWLYEFYSTNIFASNFPYMRTLESLVCQEELFEFAHISDGKIYVKETSDPFALAKAKFEIGLFLNIVDKNIP